MDTSDFGQDFYWKSFCRGFLVVSQHIGTKWLNQWWLSFQTYTVNQEELIIHFTSPSYFLNLLTYPSFHSSKTSCQGLMCSLINGDTCFQIGLPPCCAYFTIPTSTAKGFMAHTQQWLCQQGMGDSWDKKKSWDQLKAWVLWNQYMFLFWLTSPQHCGGHCGDRAMFI